MKSPADEMMHKADKAFIDEALAVFLQCRGIRSIHFVETIDFLFCFLIIYGIYSRGIVLSLNNKIIHTIHVKEYNLIIFRVLWK